VSFPAEHVVLLTLSRPKALNAMTPVLEADILAVMNWFDAEDSLWVAILTGEGRAFCAGADLKAWSKNQQKGINKEQEGIASSVHGFGGLSRRHTSSKPLIAAVNGGAYGGGVEMVLNCDIVIASEDAEFALPEVRRGVIPAQGVIPRLVATAGRQFASELMLLGRPVSAQQAHTRFGFVNLVVPRAEVVPCAIEWAKLIASNSPDAVQATKRGILMTAQHPSMESATIASAWSPESKKVYTGSNIKEGLRAFVEKRKPAWSNPARL